MNAQEQLLLSERGCSQLGLVTFHPEVSSSSKRDLAVTDDKSDFAKVPKVSVSVQAVKSTFILPHNKTTAQV